jgi:hypothetical protein
MEYRGKVKGSIIVQAIEEYNDISDKARKGTVSKLEWMMSDSIISTHLNAAETRHVLVEKDFTKKKDDNR